MTLITHHAHDHVFLGAAHEENARRTLWVVMLTVVLSAKKAKSPLTRKKSPSTKLAPLTLTDLTPALRLPKV